MMLPIEGQPILTAAQMKAAEERAAPNPEAMYQLMERAGQGVAEAVRRLAAGAEVLILCGPGNNGGDGYVAARVLREAGHPVRVAALSDPTTASAIEARRRWGTPVDTPTRDTPSAHVVVDALFGTGLSRSLDEATAQTLWRTTTPANLVVAVDLPSGVDTDGGAALGIDHHVDVTLALGALKPAHLLLPAAQHCGAVRLIDIGIEASGDVRAMAWMSAVAPGAADHKFSRGMVAVIAGRMPGASALAAGAAARIAGYTLLLGGATDRLPHAIVRRRWSSDALDDKRVGAAVIGPGLGRDDEARIRLGAALGSDCPLVIDGDALHLLDLAAVRARKAATVLTPHGGEFAALFGSGDGMGKIERAQSAARASGATIVFKGADTVVSTPEGQVRVATRHTPWLATAGTGDVLAGIIGALLAHRGDPLVAANDGVCLHTAAAIAAGPGLIADDLIDALPRVLGGDRW